jgi:hypothetical protein
VSHRAAQNDAAMITVFARSEALLARLRPHLAERDRTTVDHRADFQHSVREALVGLVAVRELDADIAEWLNGALPIDSIAQLVLVADLSTDAVRRVMGSDHGQLRVVWWEEVDRVLPGLLDELLGDPLAALCASLLGRHSLSPVLQRAVKEACLSPTPPPSVQKLSERTKVPPRTLYDHWQAELAGCLPKDLVSWAVLLRAVAMPGRRWVDVAVKLDVHPRTLERLSVRMSGLPLAAAAADRLAVWRAFSRWTRGWLWTLPEADGHAERSKAERPSVA